MLLRKTKHARTRARLMKSIIFVERIKERLVSECSEILSPKPGEAPEERRYVTPL